MLVAYSLVSIIASDNSVNYISNSFLAGSRLLEPGGTSLFESLITSVLNGSVEPVAERRPIRYGFEGYAVVMGLLCLVSAVGSVVVKYGWRHLKGRDLGPE